MSLAFKRGKSIKGELRRIARKELANIAKRLLAHRRRGEDVHESRKSVKKVEALTHLLQYIGGKVSKKDRKRLHQAKRGLSELRDTEVVLETFDQLRSRFPRDIPQSAATRIRRYLQRRRTTVMAQSSSRHLIRTGKMVAKVQRSAKHWTVPRTKVSGLPAALKHSFRASRKAMKRAQGRGKSADFHEWRKRVKTLWYQLRMVERLATGLAVQIKAFQVLETMLGEEHNLVVLKSELTRDRQLLRLGSPIDRVSRMSVALQQELRRRAIVLGTRLHRRAPTAFAKDVRRRLRVT